MVEGKSSEYDDPMRNVVSGRASAATMTVRARRRREEAVRFLVADIQSRSSTSAAAAGNVVQPSNGGTGAGDGSTGGSNSRIEADALAETHEWVIASTVATALEKGLDHDLYTELVQEVKNNALRIGQVCHDHADVFLASVAAVAALATPSADLADGLKDAQEELNDHTVGPMFEAAMQYEEARLSHARARTLNVMVDACQGIAVQLERARKQAGLGRPRAALDAVDLARGALTTPIESLFQGKDERLYKETLAGEELITNESSIPVTVDTSVGSGQLLPSQQGPQLPSQGSQQLLLSKHKLTNLEQTPFGKRAAVFLPRIENEVLMSAKRGLNRWFTSQRTGGEGAKAGRAVLRQCAHSMAVGPGALGLGGSTPPSYTWRAKMADNLIARVGQNSKVARAARQGYWFDRDAEKEANRLGRDTQEGIDRAAEAFAAAFGWYRCWEDDASLLVDPSEWAVFLTNADGDRTGSRHGGSGLAGSRHGLAGSRHGADRLKLSRHANAAGGKKTLGFRANTNSRSKAYQEISTNLGTVKKSNKSGLWTELLTPEILSFKSSTSKEEDEIFRTLAESVHPVRRAEVAFSLLGKTTEFVQFYEQNRFGEMKIAGDAKDGEGERKSALSALTGEDISMGSDRNFFSKTLPHVCASIVGYSAVESALEVSMFAEDDDNLHSHDDDHAENGVGGTSKKTSLSSTSQSNTPALALSANRFRDGSERYERSLMTELGLVIRARSMRSNLGEICRLSSLLIAFRSSLKIVHPTSTARRVDKDSLALDHNILETASRLAQDEQLRAAIAIVTDDMKVPMLVSESPASQNGYSAPKNSQIGVSDPEELGLPFGLSEMKQKQGKSELDYQEQSRMTSYNQSDEAFTFSHSIPVIIRSIHARAITCASFALSQQELGQKFTAKRGSGPAAWVLDCLDDCIGASVIGMKDNDNLVKEGSVDKAVQVMANLSAIQNSLPRLYGTIVRGMFHVGLVSADEVEVTFGYAEKSLKLSEKACDAQVGSTYSVVYEICRTKIDSHINYSLENFQWVAKTARDTPNPYCEGLIGYLKSVFASLGPMDEGSKAGLHFSCCGHVAERIVKLLSGKPGDTASMDASGIPPIPRIDAFGICNLSRDCDEFERFADNTSVPALRDCFSELRMLTSAMLDKELPTLLMPENSGARRRKYPLLSLEKVANILEKYVGAGMFAGGKQNVDILFLEKKEINQLLKFIRSQI